MSAEVITIESAVRQRDDIRRAAEALRNGAIVIFPTETVYGLAASAARADSVERLRNLKGRTDEQPFTVHIGRRSDWQDFVPSTSPLAHRFMKKGWPGPLTLIFQVDDPRQAKVHAVLSAAGAEAIYAKSSVGIRFPDDSIAEAFLADAEVPVIASSANITGRPAPTDAEGLFESLGANVDFIIEAGPTRYRKGSSIVALNGSGYKLLRAGVWDERTIRNFATLNILLVCTGNTCRSPMAEGLLKQLAAEKLGCRPDELPERGVIIRSAGTGAHGRSAASPEAVEVCSTRGIDISGHVARPLSLELVHPSDYIYTMAMHHAEAVRSMAPADASKVARLLPDEDIADPMGGTVEEYEAAAVKIEQALRQRIQEVPL